MEAVAHSPAFAKKVGVPKSVGKDFSAADKGRKFGKGGDMATKMAKGGRIVSKKELEASGFDNLRDFLNNEKGLTRKGESGRRLPTKPEGEDADIKGQPMGFKEKSVSLNRVSPTPKKSSENTEELSDMTYKRGGMAKPVKKYAKGGSIDGIAQRGKTKATMVKMNKGGKAC